jgi:hypothetical protein
MPSRYPLRSTIDLDPPGMEYRAVEEKILPPREEMPPDWGKIQEVMPPEPLPPVVYEILTAVGWEFVRLASRLWRRLLQLAGEKYRGSPRHRH